MLKKQPYLIAITDITKPLNIIQLIADSCQEVAGLINSLTDKYVIHSVTPLQLRDYGEFMSELKMQNKPEDLNFGINNLF